MTNLSDNTSPPNQKKEAQKYLFDTDFDYSETSDDVQSITPKQMAMANTKVGEKSYQDGYDKGVQDTNESITRIAGDQLFVITAKIDDLIETEKMILETFHVQVAQVCELITSKIMPTLIHQGALEEVKAVIDQAYGKLPKEQAVLIEVHSDLIELIEQHIKNAEPSESSSPQITVKAGESFNTSDCKISWQGAGIEHYTTAALKEVTEILLRLAETPLQEPEKPQIQEEATVSEKEAQDIKEDEQEKEEE